MLHRGAQLGRSFLRRLDRSLLGRIRGMTKPTASAFDSASPNAIDPLPNFCLLLLEPETVDLLELRGEPQNRSLYRRDGEGNWSVRSVNP